MRLEPGRVIVPDWPVPAHVGALMTTRAGGISKAPFDGLNIGVAVGDDPAAVAHNRRVVAETIAARPVYLKQVHGARVVEIRKAGPQADDTIEADAAVTTEPGIACAIQVADCLPVLFTDVQGRAVGAAHAGWRGLAAGVLERTAQAVCAAAACEPAALCAWLGPCIGPRAFEVGADVLEAVGHPPAGSERFVSALRADGSPAWRADLAGLARDRLAGIGVSSISAAGWCTVEDASRFFSFRRDTRMGRSGRMVALVWLRRH
jgi:polyphenol oxidase